MREESSFPENNAAEMGTDPAVERAHDAGNVPADEPETLLDVLSDAKGCLFRALRNDMELVASLAVVREYLNDQYLCGVLDGIGMRQSKLRTELDALNATLLHADQIARDQS